MKNQKIRENLKISVFILLVLTVLFFCFNTNYSGEDYGLLPQNNDTSLWVTLPPLPYPVKYHISKIWTSPLGDKYLVIAGGRINDTITRLFYEIKLSSPFTVTMLPNLPAAIEKAGGFIIKDSFYVAGGGSDFTTMHRNTVYKFNLNGGTAWQQKNNMPFALSEITYATGDVKDSEVYIAGGKKNGDTVSSSVLRYNPKTDVWHNATKMNWSRYGISLSVVTDSDIILVGGLPQGISNVTTCGHIYRLNPDSLTWSFKAAYPPGQGYNLGGWGSKRGYAVFTGGANANFPTAEYDSKNISGKYNGNNPNSVDTVFPQTYIFNFSTNSFSLIAIKPSPTTHSQLDGFIVPGNPKDTFVCYSAGGATSPSGQGTNTFENLIGLCLPIIYTNEIEPSKGIPENFTLHQNIPNPFNPVTKIYFDVSKRSFVSLKVYDILGKCVGAVMEKLLEPGNYYINFNGSKLSSGIYFIRMEADNFTDVKQMILLK